MFIKGECPSYLLFSLVVVREESRIAANNSRTSNIHGKFPRFNNHQLDTILFHPEPIKQMQWWFQLPLETFFGGEFCASCIGSSSQKYRGERKLLLRHASEEHRVWQTWICLWLGKSFKKYSPKWWFDGDKENHPIHLLSCSLHSETFTRWVVFQLFSPQKNTRVIYNNPSTTSTHPKIVQIHSENRFHKNHGNLRVPPLP